MPIFLWVTLIFLSLDHFLNLFKGIPKKKGHFSEEECPFFLSKCPFFFGIPLEMTNDSWRIAIVYISGIFLGGLLRETFSSHNNPLAGASGK